jgi:hypothetical protein
MIARRVVLVAIKTFFGYVARLRLMNLINRGLQIPGLDQEHRVLPGSV